jgi:DNA-binding NarL/FixJ family response regulator
LEEIVFYLRPDQILCDIGMPSKPVLDTCRRIRKELSSARLVFLTMYEDETYITKALEMKAAGYLLKDTPAPELLKTLRHCVKGYTVISPELVHMTASIAAVRAVRQDPVFSLTVREREITKLLAEGHVVKDIAVMMGVGVKTVEARKFSAMRS